ncbi:uncharacterized protein AAGF69_016837 [Amazona ochrocephala]
MAMCWGLACAYRALFISIQHLEKEKNVPGSEGKATDSAATPAPSTAATPAPATSTVVAQTSVTSTAATQTTVIITAAQPEDQFIPILVAPVRKGKSKTKTRKMKEQDEEAMAMRLLPGTASDQESSSHESEEEVTSRPQTSTKLQNMRKDFTHQPGEHIITWLLQCWESGANGHELEAVEKLSQELKQLRGDLSDLSSSSCLLTHVSAINKRRPTARERRYSRYTPQATLWFYLQDHGEDMTKWDGKPASVLEE